VTSPFLQPPLQTWHPLPAVPLPFALQPSATTRAVRKDMSAVRILESITFPGRGLVDGVPIRRQQRRKETGSIEPCEVDRARITHVGLDAN
jgi:hypothetical protein